MADRPERSKFEIQNLKQDRQQKSAAGQPTAPSSLALTIENVEHTKKNFKI